MGLNSKIEWTESTWNPVVGCTRVSVGCDHCYAFVMAKRLAAMGQKNYVGLAGNGHFNGSVRTLPTVLGVPMRRKKPTTYFVNSMSDLFHKSVPDEFIDQVFAVMASCPHHTFQILTKRPERMAQYMRDRDRLENIYAQWYSVSGQSPCAEAWPLPNVWLGASVENQQAADLRLPHLLRTPAAIRFLSCEPLLGPIDLGFPFVSTNPYMTITHVDWCVAGGESGSCARPADPDWFRDLRDQCRAGGCAFFMKQMGGVTNKRSDLACIPEDLRIREFPQVRRQE